MLCTIKMLKVLGFVLKNDGYMSTVSFSPKAYDALWSFSAQIFILEPLSQKGKILLENICTLYLSLLSIINEQ